MGLQDDQHSKKGKSNYPKLNKGKPKKSPKTKKTKEKKAIKALVKSKEEQAVKKSEKN
jgi:hypothetical protein